MHVARDVMTADGVAIPRGTPATAHVAWRTGKGVFGKSGKLEFDIATLSLNGVDVALAGHHRLAGEGNTVWTIVAVAGVGLLGGLFVTGHSAVAHEESEFAARVRDGTPVYETVAAMQRPAGFAPGYASVGVARRKAATPSGFCYDVPRNYYGTGSIQHPNPDALTPMCWEVLEGVAGRR